MALFTTTLTDGDDTAMIRGIDADIPWTVNALAGDDFVTVNGGWMTRCFMGDGNDVVRVNGGYYVQVDGENGNDRVDMYAASVRFNGGADNDLANIFGGLHLSADGGPGSDQFKFLADIAADVTGGDGNDLFYGNDHIITGMLQGGGGSDQFFNFHSSNPTSLTLAGGTGDDSYWIDSLSVSIAESAGGGSDTVRSSVTFTLGDNLETLRLLGSTSIHGIGNGLNNLLVGNSAANSLSGGAGDDKLWGGAGADRLWGGAGADEFAFKAGEFGGLTEATAERIRDFSHAQGDHIRLTGMDANTLASGQQHFAFIGSDGFHNVAGELRYEQVNGNTYVTGDTNGDGVADFLILLDGSHALTGSDFLL